MMRRNKKKERLASDCQLRVNTSRVFEGMSESFESSSFAGLQFHNPLTQQSKFYSNFDSNFRFIVILLLFYPSPIIYESKQVLLNVQAGLHIHKHRAFGAIADRKT
jgi:hypothetical protein